MKKTGFKKPKYSDFIAKLKARQVKRNGFTVNAANVGYVFSQASAKLHKATHTLNEKTRQVLEAEGEMVDIKILGYKPIPSKTRKTTLRARKPMKRGKGTVMSKKLRNEVNLDKEYTLCSLHNYQHAFGPCAGRVTREHAMYYAGKKIQEKWAIIPCCAQHHGVDQFQDGPGEAPKIVREWVALNRATDRELMAVSKATDYLKRKDLLNSAYGVWKSPVDNLGNITGQTVDK